MNTEFDIQQAITADLRSHRLTSALHKLKKAAENTGARDIRDEITSIESDYGLMLSYLMQGAEDPDRKNMYDRFVSRTYHLLDRLVRRQNIPSTGSLYYNTLRFEATRPDDNIAALIRRYFKIINDSSLFNLISADEDTQGHKADNRTEKEITERRLFNRLWVTFPLSGENADEVSHLLTSDEIPAYVKQLTISSLLMGSLEFFDETRLSLLIDAYIAEADNESSTIAPIALTAAVMIMLRYSHRPISQKISIKLEQASRTKTWTSDLRTIYIELVKTRDTERINRKMTDEVIPELIKLRPDIAKRHIDVSHISDLSDIEENPEWLDMLEKSGITDRLKEMSEIQEEGGDVFMSTFAHLKRFPFFNEIANWFMPFHIDHSSIAASDESSEAIADILSASPFLSNSDKYSFYFSVSTVPAQQRQMMMAQFKNYNINSAEIRSAALSQTAVDRRNTVNKYIQDLYRFFHLFSRKNEFDDPFLMRMNILRVSELAKYISDTTIYDTIAEFYFRHHYYPEALEIFRNIELTSPPQASLYQKIGFCLQKAGELEEALDYYQRAELLDARSIWTLKRIASLLSLLGRNTEALGYYTRILENQPDNVRIIIDNASALMELKQYSEAIPMLYKALYLDPENTKAPRYLAWCLLMTRDFKGADKQIRKIITRNPAPVDYLYLGHTALASGNISEAVHAYSMAIDEKTNSVEEIINRISAHIPDLENAGIDTTSIPFIIDILDRN